MGLTCSEGCNKDVAVALISFHDCSLDAKIKMDLGTISASISSVIAVYQRQFLVFKLLGFS